MGFAVWGVPAGLSDRPGGLAVNHNQEWKGFCLHTHLLGCPVLETPCTAEGVVAKLGRCDSCGLFF